VTGETGKAVLTLRNVVVKVTATATTVIFLLRLHSNKQAILFAITEPKVAMASAESTVAVTFCVKLGAAN
jgi:hypothetical protein